MFRILTIDGGGIRGIIPALVLAEIERRTGKRICELFDLIAGTSTGGILALGLTKPKPDGARAPQYTARDMAKLYENEGHRIFSSSLLHRIFSLGGTLDTKYSSGPIEDVLADYFGDAMLSEALTRVLIPSYEIELRSAFFFKSHKATGETLAADEKREDYDFLMRDVARATSAAPTYFEPELIDRERNAFALIDGGTYANNPTMCAVAEAICSTKFNKRLENVFVVSLGTGEQTRPLNYQSVKNWGLLSWAQPILSVVFHGVSDTVNYQTNLILNVAGKPKHHYRLQTKLEGDIFKLDDTRPGTIRALKGLANDLIEKHDRDIDDICRTLAPKPRRRAAAPKGQAAAGKRRVAPAKGRAAAAGTRARATKKAAR
jgi:hypothetical protein